jgi:hypothetical protein
VPDVRLVNTTLCEPEPAPKVEPALVKPEPSPTKLVAVITPTTRLFGATDCILVEKPAKLDALDILLRF